MDLMLLGAGALVCFTIGVFFLRFWKTTRDRFFLFFALSFAIEGIHRIILGLTRSATDNGPFSYLLTLLAFLIILYAIADKNRAKKPRG